MAEEGAKEECLSSPWLNYQNTVYDNTMKKMDKNMAEALHKKGFKVLTKKEYRELTNNGPYKIIFRLKTGDFFSGSLEYYKTDYSQADLIPVKAWIVPKPRPRKMIIAAENQPIKEKLKKLKIELEQSHRASEIERLRNEIQYWESQYNHQLDVVIPAQTWREAFIESIPTCAEVY